MVTFAALSGTNWWWGILLWIVVGLIAGWLAHVTVGSGSGSIVSDIIVGLIGSFVGGIIVGFFVHGTGFWRSILVAFIGAPILTWIVRAITCNCSPV
ncbi:MAG: GlsB/YeaQ/YmgE family stress response membrane protein [Thermomicrobiales bacterium]